MPPTRAARSSTIAAIFVDTNVLVYAADAGAGEKHVQARQWIEHLSRRPFARLSYQVLQEYYVTVTRKLDHPMTPEEAREDVRDLMAWDPVETDDRTLEAAWEVEERFGLSFWDALIVAAARAARCRHLLTEDLQDGMELDGVVVVNPFIHEPSATVGD